MLMVNFSNQLYAMQMGGWRLRIFLILFTMMKFGPFKWQVIGERPNDCETRIVLPNKLLAINEAASADRSDSKV